MFRFLFSARSASFPLLMSLLFHFNLIKPDDGKPHEDAVMPLFIIGSIFLYIAVQAYC